LNIGGWITGAAGAITVPGSLTTAGFTSTGIDDNATSTAITIDSSENVGIGGASDGSDLHLNITNAKLRMSDGTKFLTLGQWDTATNRVESNGADLNIVQYGASQNIKLATNATERMRIDSAGRVTMPYQPAFMATKSGHQLEAVGDNIAAPWSEKFDTGSNFNATSGVFTAPVSGVYSFAFNAMSGQTSGDVQFRIYKNGASWAGSNSMAEGGVWRQTCVATNVSMSVNDYVTFICYSSSTSAIHQLYGGVYSHVSGHLIG